VKSGAKPGEGCDFSLEQWERRNTPPMQKLKITTHVKNDRFVLGINIGYELASED
jgi:hypothetical protein